MTTAQPPVSNSDRVLSCHFTVDLVRVALVCALAVLLWWLCHQAHYYCRSPGPGADAPAAPVLN